MIDIKCWKYAVAFDTLFSGFWLELEEFWLNVLVNDGFWEPSFEFLFIFFIDVNFGDYFVLDVKVLFDEMNQIHHAIVWTNDYDR